VVHRGRKLSDSGAKARFFHEVAEARLSKIVKVDLKSELSTYDIDAQALERAQTMDGKLLLVTNVADLTPAQIVAWYKSLADIERGFKVLTSEIEIVPVYHRLPERIRAHASICFMALILYRVMRQRLKLVSRSPHCTRTPSTCWPFIASPSEVRARRSTPMPSPSALACRPPGPVVLHLFVRPKPQQPQERIEIHRHRCDLVGRMPQRRDSGRVVGGACRSGHAVQQRADVPPLGHVGSTGTDSQCRSVH